MTDFALELENYIPKPYKHTVRTDYILITNPKQYEEAVKSLTEDGVIYCRTITGKESPCTKCVGFCWNEVHRGYLTKKQMDQHQCIEKNCHRFEKIETAPYWAQQITQKQNRKDGKQAKKQAADEADKFLEKIRELTINDFNFYPVACELKDNAYEIRVINFQPFTYSQYLALFVPYAKGRKIHFTKIKADDERKQQIIDKQKIIKIALAEKPVITEQVADVGENEKITVLSYVTYKVKSILEYIKKLFSKE